MKLKIATHFGHAGHQYELWKLSHDFTCITHIGGLSNNWSFNSRPLHDKINIISRDKFNEKDYDCAIVHLDEFFIDPPALLQEREWDKPFEFFSNTNLPIIYVMHGTPRYHQLQDSKCLPKDITYIDTINNEIRNSIGDSLIICNSHQAEKEWGFTNSKVIWHGFDPDEFTSTNYKRNILTTQYSKIINRPVYNGYLFYLDVLQTLRTHNIIVDDLPITNTSSNSKTIFHNYISNLREYTTYFNPTQLSPMPRNRGEAFMCGLCMVTANNHDAGMFIENGVNGFMADSEKEASDILMLLYNNKTLAMEVGKHGRASAKEYFHINRYLQDWENVLKII